MDFVCNGYFSYMKVCLKSFRNWKELTMNIQKETLIKKTSYLSQRKHDTFWGNVGPTSQMAGHP